MYKLFFKRFLDIIISLLGIVIFIIPFLVISILIFINNPGPVFFIQKRAGKKEKGKITYFNLIKFRTMKLSTPSNIPTHLLKNPQNYITTLGKFLRKTSLDELPQLFQVLSNKMSIIGPRPALWNQEDLIAEREKCGANNIKPGLTGWAQVNGRDELNIKSKAALDGYYVNHLSFHLDLKCFFKTIKIVLAGKGIKEGA